MELVGCTWRVAGLLVVHVEGWTMIFAARSRPAPDVVVEGVVVVGGAVVVVGGVAVAGVVVGGVHMRPVRLDRQIAYVAIVTVYSMLLTMIVLECGKRLHTRPTEIATDAGRD